MTSKTIFFTAKGPTPLFNTLTSPFQFPLIRAEDGRIMAMESIAFPGTLFKFIKEHGPIWEINCSEYHSHSPLYVDSRMLQPTDTLKEREKKMPSSETILEILKKLIGTRYFWGGNWPERIYEVLKLYEKNIDPKDIDDATCCGLDCSGLLYYATNGCTPRNTSQLISFGKDVEEIDKGSAQQISTKVKPLDLVVWRGHVMIVLSDKEIIESRLRKNREEQGVISSKFIPRMEMVIKDLNAQEKEFYVRRWHI